MLGKRLNIMLLAILAASLTACRWIDDDLSDCPEPLPEKADLTFAYETRLVTNKQTEIDSVLSLSADRFVKEALEYYAGKIFKDYANDLHTDFYDAGASMANVISDDPAMVAMRREFKYSLGPSSYRHLTAANLSDCGGVSLYGRPGFELALVQQTGGGAKPDTLEAHRTGLYTARLDFDILETLPRTFNVDLFMANCGTALVVDGAEAPGIDRNAVRVFVKGFATSFALPDSTFSYPAAYPVFRTDRLPVNEGTESCFACIHFPTRDPRTDSSIRTRSYTETKEPFKSPFTVEPMFVWEVYVKLPSGSITKTSLSVYKPVRAGQLKIVKCKLDGDGHVYTDAAEVGASVQLNWTPGNEYDIEL